ncbi:2TM domain-containing protein [Virgibacillus doumboii]|uniref:2TM domain-containing protein n=1 Tax=Virgibacillus doumboii TaxID=2697503 RepID=UPI0013DF2E7B|nr:2TM domain-containing protein [Virgibacillus doumboii]
MIGWFIVACEIGFWVFVLSGLVARYILKKKKLGAVLLICTPVVDLLLLIATVIDLKNGATATTVHGVAAIYIGVSVAFGHQMIDWADRYFSYWFADGKKPVKKKKYGKEYAKRERGGWYRHLLAWCIGTAILGGIILYINNPSQTEVLFRTLQFWSLILVIDFVISFSYTLFPKKENSGWL